jgi:hypothetical protein
MEVIGLQSYTDVWHGRNVDPIHHMLSIIGLLESITSCHGLQCITYITLISKCSITSALYKPHNKVNGSERNTSIYKGTCLW